MTYLDHLRSLTMSHLILRKVLSPSTLPFAKSLGNNPKLMDATILNTITNHNPIGSEGL